jgi:putative colanic acid biosynthesis acetyltransferase WcaF
MPQHKVDLASFNNAGFDRGAPRWKEICWLLVSAIFFQHPLSLWNGAKICWLRLFGAKVGCNVLIKPQVLIKFPWKLVLEDNIWIGEKAWIDNLDLVHIHPNVCISQGAYLLTGNHDYKKSTFDLIVRPIHIHEGAWIGAMAVVNQGINVGAHAVLTTGSVATQHLEPYGIYQGNPAARIRTREIQ